jgi:GGDEF domain-containing protein
MPDSLFEDDARVLKQHAFEFVLDGELKRAVRSQNFLTLVTLETNREWDGMSVTADDGTVGEVAEIVRHEVRDTDVLGFTNQGQLSLVLLDADYSNSTKVIDRLIQRMEHYDFPSPLRISVGAACYPTHAVDAESLKQQAVSHPVVNWRGGKSSHSHQ